MLYVYVYVCMTARTFSTHTYDRSTISAHLFSSFHLKADSLMRVILIIRSASADQRRKKRESQRMDAVGKKINSPGRFEMNPSRQILIKRGLA